MIQITIIIPTYNPSNYLIECINSIYNQTLDRTKYETIIILNGELETYRDFLIKIYQSKPYDFSMKILETAVTW